MEFWLCIIFFFIFLLPLVLGIIVPIYKRHHQVTGGIVNHDSTMRKFVYKIDLTSEDMIALLETKNDTDELSCAVDRNRSAIQFTEYGSGREYSFQVQECGGFSILRLEQVPPMGMQSHIPYKLNPFLVRKLHAEIVPYAQYGFQGNSE